jgi:hypothetical protein
MPAIPSSPLHGFAPSRRVWHAVGVAVAALVAALILWGYRQPDFLLDIAAMRLC